MDPAEDVWALAEEEEEEEPSSALASSYTPSTSLLPIQPLHFPSTVLPSISVPLATRQQQIQEVASMHAYKTNHKGDRSDGIFPIERKLQSKSRTKNGEMQEQTITIVPGDRIHMRYSTRESMTLVVTRIKQKIIGDVLIPEPEFADCSDYPPTIISYQEVQNLIHQIHEKLDSSLGFMIYKPKESQEPIYSSSQPSMLLQKDQLLYVPHLLNEYLNDQDQYIKNYTSFNGRTLFIGRIVEIFEDGVTLSTHLNKNITDLAFILPKIKVKEQEFDVSEQVQMMPPELRHYQDCFFLSRRQIKNAEIVTEKIQKVGPLSTTFSFSQNNGASSPENIDSRALSFFLDLATQWEKILSIKAGDSVQGPGNINLKLERIFPHSGMMDRNVCSRNQKIKTQLSKLKLIEKEKDIGNPPAVFYPLHIVPGVSAEIGTQVIFSNSLFEISTFTESGVRLRGLEDADDTAWVSYESIVSNGALSLPETRSSTC